MIINKVLLFKSDKSKVTENDIEFVEKTLDSYRISHTRCCGNDCGDGYDAIIALGGDGTMLNACRIAFRKGLPILSINFGTLGYMSGLEKSELGLLAELKSGCRTEKRMLLDIKVYRNEEIIAESTALNEAVIARSADGDIAELELLCDGSNVCAYRADGLIFATPTGSSAYSMSAGGPIIDTKLDAFCVCPICSHSLGARAMVFSPNSILEARNNDRTGGNNILLSDGRRVCTLEQGDVIKVTRSEHTLELIKLKKDAFYETLYNKMS